MIISKSNFASDATVTITPESATQDVSVIVDGDYSSVYSDSLSGQTVIDLDFGRVRNIEYIAIGGSNISTKDRLIVLTTNSEILVDANGDEILDADGNNIAVLPDIDGGVYVDDTDLGLSESRVLVYKLDVTEVQEIRILIEGSGQLKIAEIACGEIYTVPNGGEQSGYSRGWSVPNISNRSATNLQNAPISHAYESRSLSATLTVPNSLMVNYEEYYAMLDFATRNTFYILEDDNKFHSYACFNGSPNPVAAHSQTRSLGSTSMKFNIYSRENEVIFL